jgi:RNA polymerase sigma factor (sigma-70 family)
MAEIVSKAVWAKLLRRVAKRTSYSCDAEDFLNSAYLRLDHYRASHEVNNPRAFLVRTALNIGIDRFRRNRLEGEAVGDFGIQDALPLQDDVIAARERLERVIQGLEQLSSQSRQVLLMRRLDGKSYDEIAIHFGVSRRTVERIITKATIFLAEWSNGW